MSGVSNVERCLNTGYAATDDQDGISDWNLYLFLRLKQTSPRHCHLHNIFGFFGRRLAVIQVHPAAVLSDVSHFQQIRVQPGFSDTFAEGGLMKPRRAGSYDYAVQLMFFNVFISTWPGSAQVYRFLTETTTPGSFSAERRTSSVSTDPAMFSPQSQTKTPILSSSSAN
jgi:hypothetical protein